MSTVLCLAVIAVSTKCPTIYVVSLIGSITMATMKIIKEIFSLGLSAISLLSARGLLTKISHRKPLQPTIRHSN
jgi:hypothetical protein